MCWSASRAKAAATAPLTDPRAAMTGKDPSRSDNFVLEFRKQPIPCLIVSAFPAGAAGTPDVRLKRRERDILVHRAKEHMRPYLLSMHHDHRRQISRRHRHKRPAIIGRAPQTRARCGPESPNKIPMHSCVSPKKKTGVQDANCTPAIQSSNRWGDYACELMRVEVLAVRRRVYNSRE